MLEGLLIGGAGKSQQVSGGRASGVPQLVVTSTKNQYRLNSDAIHGVGLNYNDLMDKEVGGYVGMMRNNGNYYLVVGLPKEHPMSCKLGVNGKKANSPCTFSSSSSYVQMDGVESNEKLPTVTHQYEVDTQNAIVGFNDETNEPILFATLKENGELPEGVVEPKDTVRLYKLTYTDSTMDKEPIEFYNEEGKVIFDVASVTATPNAAETTDSDEEDDDLIG